MSSMILKILGIIAMIGGFVAEGIGKYVDQKETENDVNRIIDERFAERDRLEQRERQDQGKK